MLWERLIFNSRCLVIVTGFLVISCKKKDPATPPDVGYDYYPISIGKYAEYEADSTIYDELTFAASNSKYRIKEKIEEEFIDVEGKTAYRLMRYIKKYDSTQTYDQQEWIIKDAWQINPGQTNTEVVEENVRFSKLIYPVMQDSKWDGNAKNSLGEWEYAYSYVDKTENINGLSFDNVLLVKQKDFRTLISYQYYIEKYARGVGLVYREIIDLKFPVTPLNTPVSSINNKTGTIYTLKILKHGHE